MKKILNKMIPLVGIVLLSTGLLSCSSDNDDELGLNTVAVPINIGSLSHFTDDAQGEKVFSKLKELQFIGSYTKVIGYIVLPVEFKQENVKSADMDKVLADLTAKAHSHYAVALDNVNKFDFNSLISDELAAGDASIDVTIGDKIYAVDVVVQKPLIWDKTWSTAVEKCPVQEMSFEQKTEGVIGQLRLQDDTTVPTTKVQRGTSTQVVITAADRIYVFKILSTTQMQLTGFKIGQSPLTDVTSENYLFNHKS